MFYNARMPLYLERDASGIDLGHGTTTGKEQHPE